jgi:hypothetical protein
MASLFPDDPEHIIFILNLHSHVAGDQPHRTVPGNPFKIDQFLTNPGVYQRKSGRRLGW